MVLPRDTQEMGGTMSKTKKTKYKTCRVCGDDYDIGRYDIGFRTCKDCGDIIAKQRKFTVACNNKQGYELIYDPKDLRFTNPKRTI